ncbi:hypothetical protein [Rickettsia endosymbiont of Pantilius tunicatus]|uniref:hypothetical protein n=1 Tax=Rickettsia endosymbiont of Pantilius tunicatus TaxID=3066267 RepID=UPI00376EA4AA
MILRLYCCLTFIIIVFDISIAHASAWLLEQGRYRYVVGGNKINKLSKNEKKQREEQVLYINKRIMHLRQYLEEVKNQPNLQAKILRQIKKSEQQIVELLSYQDAHFANSCIEYGIA